MTEKWTFLEKKAFENQDVRKEDLLAVLESSDTEILDLVASARRVRERFFGKKVKLQFLVNVKSGLCSEDCRYCSQSKVSQAPIQTYSLMTTEDILACAKRGLEVGATKVCLVASGDAPSPKEVESLKKTIKELKNNYPGIELCASLGVLNETQAEGLSSSGLGTYNHNINTSQNLYKDICTTHTYEDRVRTIETIQKSGMHLCSGIIAGMGETNEDLIQMAMDLKHIKANYIPINFLVPVEKTPFEGTHYLTPFHALRILAMMRFANPNCSIRIAGGREYHLRSLQPLGLMMANSIFVGDYLTTKGQTAALDLAMIRDLGYSIEGQPDDFIDSFFASHPDFMNDIGAVLGDHL